MTADLATLRAMELLGCGEIRVKPQGIPTRRQAIRLAEATTRYGFQAMEHCPTDRELLATGWIEPVGKAFTVGEKSAWIYLRLSEEGWQAPRRYFAETEEMPR